jgi:hypothetical protein
LPPADRPILARLFALNENYAALAAELAAGAADRALAARQSAQAPARSDNRSLPVPCAVSLVPSDLFDLYAWADQPHIAAWIERHRTLSDLQRRNLALAALETVIKAAPTPTEKRRAATTLLRALDGRWSQASRSRDRSGHASPFLTSCFRAAAPTSPPPLPLSTPTPKADPSRSIADIRAAFACAAPAVALSTLHAHCAHNAFIAGQAVHQARVEWIAIFPTRAPAGFDFPLTITQAGEILRDGSVSRWDLWLRSRADHLFRCTLTLIRDSESDYPNPSWRIATLEVIPHNTG